MDATAAAATAVADRPTGPRWRRRLAVILIVVGAVLSPLAVDALWIKRTVLETDQFVAQLGPLADDADIQEFVSQEISDELIAAADLETRLQGTLPADLQFLDGTLATAGNQLITEATKRVVASDQFAELWRDALALAHDEVIAVLTGDTRVVDVEDGTVSIDVTSAVDRVLDRLDDTGLGQFLPADDGEPYKIVLYESDALASAQSLIELLDFLGFVLPFLVLVCLGAAIALSLDRRRAVFRVGLALTIAMIVHLLALALGRSLYLDSIVPAVPEPAATSIYNILVTFPQVGTRSVLLAGILLMIGAAVLGPTTLAARIRAIVLAGLGRAGTAVGRAEPAGPVAAFVARYRTLFDVGVLVVAVLVFFSFDRTTPGSLLVLVLVTLFFLGLVHVLAVAGRSGAGPATPDATLVGAAPSSVPPPPDLVASSASTPPTSPPTAPGAAPAGPPPGSGWGSRFLDDAAAPPAPGPPAPSGPPERADTVEDASAADTTERPADG